MLLFALVGGGTANAQGTEDEPTPILISAAPIEPGKITVTGSATRSTQNDQATVNLTVASTRDRALDAVMDVNAAMDDVIVALMGLGIEATDLRTTGVSLQPQYDFTQFDRVLIGIRFSNSLLVTIDDVDLVGEILDAAITAGGDLLSLNGVSFSVSNRAAIETVVRLVAVDDAIAKATAITERLGLVLGRAISVREVGFSSPVRAPGIATDEAFAAPAPAIFVGDQAVTVRIEVVFEMWPAPADAS
jgi:uncharacterized protein YggE